MTPTPGQRAESLISEFFISDPRELDVEAISLAMDMGVEYEFLSGCEATLVGFVDSAIATINHSSVRGRERFSIGHELGHWMMHRGKSFRCRVDEPDLNWLSNIALEKEADEFAAHLLLPSSIFNPAVKQIGKPDFNRIEELATLFETSLLATCFRLADIDTLPVILACYDSTRRLWWKSSAHIPRRWFLKDRLDEDSFAYDLLHSGKQPKTLGKQSADAWFKNDDAEKYEVWEHCIGRPGGQVLVLLYLPDPMMQNGRFDPSVGTTRHNQYGSYMVKGNRKF